jgi:hypothetical protein
MTNSAVAWRNLTPQPIHAALADSLFEVANLLEMDLDGALLFMSILSLSFQFISLDSRRIEPIGAQLHVLLAPLGSLFSLPQPVPPPTGKRLTLECFRFFEIPLKFERIHLADFAEIMNRGPAFLDENEFFQVVVTF